MYIKCMMQKYLYIPISVLCFIFSTWVIRQPAKDKGTSTLTQHIISIHS